MKDGVNIPGGRQSKTYGSRRDDLLNRKWTKTFIIEFLSRSIGLEIGSVKPDFVTYRISWLSGAVKVSISFHRDSSLLEGKLRVGLSLLDGTMKCFNRRVRVRGREGGRNVRMTTVIKKERRMACC